MAYSPLVALAFRLRERVDEEYRAYAEAYLARALGSGEVSTFVNAKGLAKGKSERDLLVGPWSTQYRAAYATEEFRNYLARHPYKTIADFEASHARQYAALLGVSPPVRRALGVGYIK